MVLNRALLLGLWWVQESGQRASGLTAQNAERLTTPNAKCQREGPPNGYWLAEHLAVTPEP